MINAIENFIQKLWGHRQEAAALTLKYLRRFSEFVVILAALWLLAGYNTWVLIIDPTAAVMDAGVYQLLVLGICKFLLATGFAWVALRLQFPKLYKYLDDELEDELKRHHSQSWESRIKFSTWYFLAYLAGALYCMA
jgi:hypothetical protein